MSREAETRPTQQRRRRLLGRRLAHPAHCASPPPSPSFLSLCVHSFVTSGSVEEDILERAKQKMVRWLRARSLTN